MEHKQKNQRVTNQYMDVTILVIVTFRWYIKQDRLGGGQWSHFSIEWLEQKERRISLSHDQVLMIWKEFRRRKQALQANLCRLSTSK